LVFCDKKEWGVFWLYKVSGSRKMRHRDSRQKKRAIFDGRTKNGEKVTKKWRLKQRRKKGVF